MPDAPLLPDDEPVSIPSERTMRGGDPATLGRIDHYDLLRKLGGGGFGVVYLARDTVSGVEVALKTLHPLLKHNAEEMDLLREKFRLVHGLTHPNIAKALVIHLVREINIRDEAARAELKLSPGDSVMVMDYAPGVTLSKWCRQFPGGIVPFDLALEIGRQVAAALDYAHSEKIVHRDIKPSNVMVETVMPPPAASGALRAPSGPSGRLSPPGSSDASGASGRAAEAALTRPQAADAGEAGRLKLRVRILDFGLAAEIRSSMSRVSTEAGDTSGTRPYMAPEQWLGKKQDGRTDQYALACVLYELLSGAPPFAGVFETGDPMIMMATVKGETPDEIDGVDPAANAALLRALAKAPKDRFPSCAAFVATLGGADAADEPQDPAKSGTRNPDSGREPAGGASSAALEADVLRRKVALMRALSAISAEDKMDSELAAFVSDAEVELSATDEACKFGRFSAAAACLDRVDAALERLRRTKNQRKEAAERAAREKAARLQAEREAKARAEREASARLQAERDAKEKAERKEAARLQAERKVKEKVEREERGRRLASETKPGTVRIFEIAPGVPMEFCWCPATTSESWKHISGGDTFFRKGCSFEGIPVKLTKGFWMGRFPVTQEQWTSVMGSNPSKCLCGKNLFGFGGRISPRRPVDSVSWKDCERFIERCCKYTGLRFSLPTEAQYEYATRAGTDYVMTQSGLFSLHDTELKAFLKKQFPWFLFKKFYSELVDDFRKNTWGIQGCFGGGCVWQWCADWNGSYQHDTLQDPLGPSSGEFRVLKGGFQYFALELIRIGVECHDRQAVWTTVCCSNRYWADPGFRNRAVGFRVCFQDDEP